MTEQKLIEMGFKKRSFGDVYWYLLKMGKHEFITNDTIRNKRKDKWFVGYRNRPLDDFFWFNEKLSDTGIFKVVFHLLTGVDFKLANQRPMFKK